MDRLLIIWKSDLSDRIKHNFFPSSGCRFYYMDTPHGRWLSVLRKSLMEIAQECYKLCWTNPRSNILQNSSCTATYYPSLKSSKQYMQGTVGEVRMNLWAAFSYGPLQTDVLVLDNQLDLIYTDTWCTLE